MSTSPDNEMQRLAKAAQAHLDKFGKPLRIQVPELEVDAVCAAFERCGVNPATIHVIGVPAAPATYLGLRSMPNLLRDPYAVRYAPRQMLDIRQRAADLLAEKYRKERAERKAANFAKRQPKPRI